MFVFSGVSGMAAGLTGMKARSLPDAHADSNAVVDKWDFSG